MDKLIIGAAAVFLLWSLLTGTSKFDEYRKTLPIEEIKVKIIGKRTKRKVYTNSCEHDYLVLFENVSNKKRFEKDFNEDKWAKMIEGDEGIISYRLDKDGIKYYEGYKISEG